MITTKVLETVYQLNAKKMTYEFAEELSKTISSLPADEQVQALTLVLCVAASNGLLMIDIAKILKLRQTAGGIVAP